MEEQRESGVFSCQELKKAVRDKIIFSTVPIDKGQIQPASLDLRLGPHAYRLVASFLPENEEVKRKFFEQDMYDSDFVMYEHETIGGMVLEKGGIYLIPLAEELNLPWNVEGKVNPKSTTGRLDIFTRVITYGNHRFDDIATGYKGKLFLEVMPRSFTIKVKEGLSLVQLRLRYGNSNLSDLELRKLQEDTGLIYEKGRRIPGNEVRVSNGIFMRVDLSGDKKGMVGYKAKKNSNIIDLTKRNYYNVEDFWEPIYRRNKKDTLILEPEEFYILASKEKIRIPPMYAADMAPYEASSGELRTHYAGFFDPGFGFGANGKVKGTKAVLEVRAHDVPFMIAHGQTFCKLFFERMHELPDKVYGPKIGSSYQYQGITLGKQFKKHN
jgi:dCTP deaminase